MGSKSERKQSSAVVIPLRLLPQGKNRGQPPERSQHEQKREIPPLPVAGEKGHPGAPVSGGREPERAESVQNVRKTNGRISLEQRVRDAWEEDDEWQD